MGIEEPPTVDAAPPAGAQPRCALHPAVEASATCARCGNYMCAECTSAEAFTHCPPCRERLGIAHFPLRRDNWSISEVLNRSWTAFARSWAPLCLAAILLYGIVFAVTMFFSIIELALVEDFPVASTAVSLLSSVVQNLLQGVLQLGMFAMCFQAFAGESVEIGALFGQVRKLGKLIVQSLVVVLALVPVAALVGGLAYVMFEQVGTTAMIISVAVAGLVLLVPGVYVGLGLFFMQYELAYDDAVGPVEAIKRSWALARGQRLPLFGIGVIVVLVVVAGALMCCVGLIAADPLSKLIACATFLALRNGSELPAPVRSGGATPVL